MIIRSSHKDFANLWDEEINKYQFSHRNKLFDKDINERVSLTLLYKETDIFGSK